MSAIKLGDWKAKAAEARYSPALLAKHLGVSIRSLQRYFRQHYGRTATDCLRDIRLRQACERLSRGEAVKHVAYELGYKQTSHFSRDFRSLFGLPPSEVGTAKRHWTHKLVRTRAKHRADSKRREQEREAA
jgi:AraC-like DNA-binding protein